MKKCLIGALYVISALLCGVLVIAFVEKVYFHVAPVIVIVVLALQAVIFFARDTATSSNISSGNLNSTEVGLLLRTIAYVTLCAIPLIFPLVFFVDAVMGSIISCVVWLLTFFVGFFVFRIKYGSRIKNRMIIEEIELSKQKKREEQGKI